MRAQPDPEQQNLFSVTALAVVPAKVGRSLQSAWEGSLRPPEMSWRTMKEISEGAGMLRSLKGCDEVEEGSGGSWALPACQL